MEESVSDIFISITSKLETVLIKYADQAAELKTCQETVDHWRARAIKAENTLFNTAK